MYIENEWIETRLKFNANLKIHFLKYSACCPSFKLFMDCILIKLFVFSSKSIIYSIYDFHLALEMRFSSSMIIDNSQKESNLMYTEEGLAVSSLTLWPVLLYMQAHFIVALFPCRILWPISFIFRSMDFSNFPVRVSKKLY